MRPGVEARWVLTGRSEKQPGCRQRCRRGSFVDPNRSLSLDLFPQSAWSDLLSRQNETCHDGLWLRIRRAVCAILG